MHWNDRVTIKNIALNMMQLCNFKWLNCLVLDRLIFKKNFVARSLKSFISKCLFCCVKLLHILVMTNFHIVTPVVKHNSINCHNCVLIRFPKKRNDFILLRDLLIFSESCIKHMVPSWLFSLIWLIWNVIEMLRNSQVSFHKSFTNV